jgi:hypothetical protein
MQGLRPCEWQRATKSPKCETYKNSHFNLQLAPELFDAIFIACITFPEKSEEGSLQLIGFKIWSRTGYWYSP